jgi:hypothetical protein
MNRDDIIRMARETGDYLVDKRGREDFIFDCYGIERFAALVAAAERERLKWDGLHSCHPECDRPACVHTRKAVEAEREACAVIAFNAKTYIEAANAIRARGQG